MSTLVVPLSRIGLSDLPRVGGKGANLGELCRAGFPVPPGFCVTTQAFRAFVAGAPPDVFAPLHALEPDLEHVRRAGTEVRARLGRVPPPPSVADEARAAWEALGRQWSYAVRSSATAEDLPDASFAGQQDTYLNLRGAEAVLDGIHRCWVSLFTDRAILYRLQHGFAHDEVALAVVVQRMVLPEVAGILFTADPVTSSRAIVSIDAGFGLGEGLVSGRVSADLYRVHKASGRLVHKRIADKVLAIVPRPEGGTREVALSDAERTRPALTDEQAEALGTLGRRIEAHYGGPQDVEWCLSANEVFVVQSRPITTLHPLPDPPPDPDSVARGPHVYVSWNHVQSMTDPMPDLARSLILLANPLGKGGRPDVATPYMASAGGRLYHDATDLLRIGFLARRIPKVVEQSDPLMGRALAEVVGRPEFAAGARTRATVGMMLSLCARATPVALRTLRHLAFGSPETEVPAAAARLEAKLAEWRGRLDAASPGADRLREVRERVRDIVADIDPTLPLIFASFVANSALRWLTARPEGVAVLLRATPHNVLTEKDERLAAIAELARPHGEVAALLRDPPAGGAVALLGALAPWPSLREALERWFDRFGDRAPGEVDVSRPRYREDPRPVLKALVAMLDGPPGAFAAQHTAFAAAAEQGTAALVVAASSRWGRLAGPLARRLARVGRQLFAARELPKFYWLRVLGTARRVFLEEGARMVREGVLVDADDVWFLTLDELVRVGDGDREPVSRIASRRTAHRRAHALDAARVLTSDGEAVTARHDSAHAPPGALVGVSASPGVAEGVVRVVADPAVETLGQGEVLVAAYTDPGWTPLFPRAAGLVMEVGGQMTHGSVVAREYGIPAVVCVPGATRLLRDGERVRVDGDHGWVLPLGSGTSAPTSAAVENIATAAPTLHPEKPTEA